MFLVNTLSIVITSCLLLFFVSKQLLRQNKKNKAKAFVKGIDSFTKICDFVSDAVDLPGVTRAYVIKVINVGTTQKKDYFMRVLTSVGKNAFGQRTRFQYLTIDDEYNKFINTLKTKGYIEIIVEQLPDCELKKVCDSIGTKALVSFAIVNTKDLLIYGSVITENIGDIIENRSKINDIIKYIDLLKKEI